MKRHIQRKRSHRPSFEATTAPLKGETVIDEQISLDARKDSIVVYFGKDVGADRLLAQRGKLKAAQKLKARPIHIFEPYRRFSKAVAKWVAGEDTKRKDKILKEAKDGILNYTHKELKKPAVRFIIKSREGKAGLIEFIGEDKDERCKKFLSYLQADLGKKYEPEMFG